MNRFVTLRTTFLLALAAAAASCSGGSTGTGTIFSGAFSVLGTEPLNGGRLFLNDPIRFDFSTPVELTTADLNTVSFSVLDLNGNPVAEQPTGHFELAKRPGDDVIGRRLMFVPTLPSDDDYSNGGFRPGRTYLVRLVGGDRHNDSVLKDQLGNGLGNAQTFRFSTADGTTPAQLFRNGKAGGPRRAGFSVTPSAEAAGVALNKFGTPTVEVRVQFDQPLNPNSGNVPVKLDTNPLLRAGTDKGRVYLQYREGLADVWIPADVSIEVNDLDRSTVLLRPVGVLPNSATIEVIVQSTMEDISGESNVGNAAYNPVFATFRTQPAFEPQFDAVVERFTSSDRIDFDAAFMEPQAEVGNGFVRSGFEFEGTTTQLEYEPNVAEVRLSTDFTTVEPKNGLPFNVSGGVFNFRTVTIPQGVTVSGVGTRPMVWLVGGDFTVNGTLTVRGSDGSRVNTLNSANFPTAGGVGVCGGGNGGRGSPSSTARSFTGQAGFGPLQKPGTGGGAGAIACTNCNIGSGGGGGSLATQGDPFYKIPRGAGTSFQQVDGLGGNGCDGASGAGSRNIAGGTSGPRVFTDANFDNDFWGAGVAKTGPTRQIRIRGELAAPVGGGGGGGGGDHSTSCAVVDPLFYNDNTGGGGGGGGGVLVVKALGTIKIGLGGKIDANGGHGGGGEPAGSCSQGGGGGGGAGGMVILMSAKGIDITAQSTGTLTTYTESEYRFSISADGGICKTGQYLSPDVEQKYAPTGFTGTVLAGAQYDIRPLGGFGGLGVIQLMAPPGDPGAAVNLDGTNTALDDNITFRWQRPAGVQVATGIDKQNLIGWRGFRNPTGVLVADNGSPINLIPGQGGDIRPSPILLPVPFNSVTRVRSKWIDLGSAARRSVASPAGEPRSITDPTGSLRGPTFVFAGVHNNFAEPLQNGYADYVVVGGSARVNYPAILPTPAPILSAAATPAFRGAAAYRVELTGAALGTEIDRYVGYDAELLNASETVLGSFRILTHSDRVLTLAAEDGLLPAGAAVVQVRAKFFKVLTDGVEGLGGTYVTQGRTVPLASVKVGFAFHQNPDPTLTGFLRYPADSSQFAYDLTDPTVIETLRQQGMRYVQWDVQFNTTYESTGNDLNPRPFGPTSPRPELRFLRLPFRF